MLHRQPRGTNWTLIMVSAMLPVVAFFGYLSLRAVVNTDKPDTDPVINIWMPTVAHTPTKTPTPSPTSPATSTPNMADIYGTCDEKGPGDPCVIPTHTPLAVLPNGSPINYEVKVCDEDTPQGYLCFKPTLVGSPTT